MSKFRRGRIAALVLVAGLATGTLGGQTGKPAARTSIASAIGSVAASDEILAKVSALRGLAILHPVPSGFKSRDDIRSLVLKDFDGTAKAAEFDDTTALLKFLRLVGPEFELRRETTQLLTEQIAGFYEPKSRFFYLADWIPIDEQRAVIAHELTHALADQHFNLRRFEKWSTKNGDAKLAAHALVEGEATALMVQYSLAERGLPSDLAKLPVSLKDVLLAGVTAPDPDHPVYSNAPDVLKQSLQFPYVYGAGFVQVLVRDGAWRRVDDCYRALPQSSEQIMHPEKYLHGEAPVLVGLPNISPLLGKGWRRADDDVTGEFGCFVLLKSTLGETRAAQAAAGWGGDRYGFYRDPTGTLSTYVQRSAWDSVDDAREYFEASTAHLESMYGTARSESPTALRTWETPDGIVRLERRDTSVLLLQGYRGARLQALVTTLWRAVPSTPRG